MPQIDPQTELSVANAALSSIKAGRLLSIDADDTDKSRIVRKHFAAVRDSLQRLYRWNFNEDYLALPEGGAAVPSGFKFCHRYPFSGDILGVREVVGCGREDWKVQKRSVLCNAAAPLKVVASVRITDVSLWDPLFKATMIAALAYAIAPEASKDDDTIARAKKAASEALAQATPVDANEGTADEPEEQDVILARF